MIVQLLFLQQYFFCFTLRFLLFPQCVSRHDKQCEWITLHVSMLTLKAIHATFLPHIYDKTLIDCDGWEGPTESITHQVVRTSVTSHSSRYRPVFAYVTHSNTQTHINVATHTHSHACTHANQMILSQKDREDKQCHKHFKSHCALQTCGCRTPPFNRLRKYFKGTGCTDPLIKLGEKMQNTKSFTHIGKSVWSYNGLKSLWSVMVLDYN